MTNQTKQTALLLSAIFAGNKGKFAGLQNYVSSTTGEIANHVLQTACNFDKMKIADCLAMINCSDAILNQVAKEQNISIETVKEAQSELAISATRNLNDATRTKQSEAQIDAYQNFGNGIKVHKKTESIKIFALGHSKKVLKAGVYKTVNSRPKTIAKNAIKKALKLYELKYRYFTIENANNLKIQGNDIIIL